MGSVVAALPSLGISEDLATELRNYLSTTAGELTDTTPDPVSGGAFGQSPASLQCLSDAQKARTHVANALKDMAKGLEGYDTAQADLARKAAQADACVAPSFAAQSTCTLPGTSSEGD